MAHRRVLLADCDAMFCAVARLVDPEGAGQAPLLIVGGTAESRGVVCSASYETRVFGVRSGMAISQALRLCPGALCVPVPRRACGEKSREVADVLREWAPVVEPASIDEFYLALDGTEAVYRHEPLADTAARIRADVLERTGLSVSIGGGTNRLIAKLATEHAKPKGGLPGNGVHIVPPGTEESFVATLELATIPGVGPKMQERLRRLGIVRVADALGVDEETLSTWFGPRAGPWLFNRLRGRASAEVSGREDAKSVSREETFSRDLATDEDLETELLRLAERLGQDLRRAGLRARTLTVKLRDYDFRTRQASRTVPVPVTTGRAIYTEAAALLRRLRDDRRVAARLVGIGATGLSATDAGVQLALFDGVAETTAGETGRDRAVAAALDRINAKFGDRTIRAGRLVRPDAPRSP